MARSDSSGSDEPFHQGIPRTSQLIGIQQIESDHSDSVSPRAESPTFIPHTEDVDEKAQQKLFAQERRAQERAKQKAHRMRKMRKIRKKREAARRYRQVVGADHSRPFLYQSQERGSDGEEELKAQILRQQLNLEADGDGQEQRSDGDGGGGHGAFEIDEDALALSGLGQAEVTAVDGGEFVGAVVKAVPREGDVGVWEGDAGEGGIVEIGCGAAWEVVAAEEPVTVHGVDAAG